MIFDEGRKHFLKVCIEGSIPTSTLYAGLISANGFTGLSATDTLASHPGWIEETGYTIPGGDGGRLPLGDWLIINTDHDLGLYDETEAVGNVIDRIGMSLIRPVTKLRGYFITTGAILISAYLHNPEYWNSGDVFRPVPTFELRRYRASADRSDTYPGYDDV